MPIDIFDTERPAPDRVFRYPLYERFLWVTVVAAGIAVAVFFGQVRDFVRTEGPRAWIVIGVVAFFLLLTIWISLRAWLSKVVISPVSLKATVFGQGVQRISWVHIQKVIYRWRPLGHKLIFIGSDGARVSFRSCIQGYEQLLAFIRESSPEHVLDQLDAIFGEPEEEEEEEPEAKSPEPEEPAPTREAAAKPEPPAKPERKEPPPAPPPAQDQPAEVSPQDGDEPGDDDDEEGEDDEGESDTDEGEGDEDSEDDEDAPDEEEPKWWQFWK
ncbi:MAG TPA: hypothetical protein PLE19_08985 [Planctomycetota bacterium]|nr:hypothetical protein [Planctomycetota bacterium]HRR80409.1 hypothetical protein [Planctomycetota bacterium]HRT96051.1 hypothetical protein [Planctomycetota bacterium]